ncbi:MAG: hypothetical protein SH847_19830 [Roseiflexaceae bacterium]|nr:hypothetical protein [Roseiflexaceae bacterium]
MSDEIARLQNELTQLNAAIAALANLPDAQAALQLQLAHKQAMIEKLRGQPTQASSGNVTNITGDVSGQVFSGSFHGPVTIGPQVSGHIQSGRDVNFATNQTITNQGDTIRVGDISGSSGVAIGRNARAISTGGGDYAERDIDKRKGTFVSGDQHNSGNTYTVSGSGNIINSTLTNVNQLIGAATQLNPQDAEQLKGLVAQLSAELEKARTQNPEAAAEVAKRTEDAVSKATAPKPDKEDVEYTLGRLTKAATNIGGVIGTVLPIATQIADFIRKMVGL